MSKQTAVTRMLRGLWLGTVAVMLVSGCTTASHPAGTPVVRYDTQSLGKHSSGPIVYAKVDVGQTLDALCMAGGGELVGRSEGRVQNGTRHLNVNTTLSSAAAYTGLQIGYVLDSNAAPSAPYNNGTIRWLPPLFSSGSQRIEIRPAEWETKSARWAFYYQINPGRSELCFTGFGEGAFELKVEARP